MLDQACVHGRFQPPHLGHLEYILAAKEKCRFLWIGITQFNIRDLKKTNTASHRGFSECNPLTYWERQTALTIMLEACHISRDHFGFIPFPIETPDLIPDFLNMNIPCITTVYDKWNAEKISTLKDLGYCVEVLWTREKKVYEGADVREKIRNNDELWKVLVHPAVVQYLVRENICGRM